MLAGALALSVVACGSGDVSTPSSTVGPASTQAASDDPTTTEPATQTTATQPTNRSEEPVDESAGPAYDVFLAAVGETVADTRFTDVPFDEPELTVATGLALCEAVAADGDTDTVISDFLAGLAGGDPSTADDEQLVLAGAILGAAETTLCSDE